MYVVKKKKKDQETHYTFDGHKNNNDKLKLYYKTS